MINNDLKELPEKWYITITEESLPYINKVRSTQKEYNKPLILKDYVYYGNTTTTGVFQGCGSLDIRTHEEISLEQFKKWVFKELEVETYPTEINAWKEYVKAKNLSLDNLKRVIGAASTCNFSTVYSKLNGEGTLKKAELLFEEWNGNDEQAKPKFEVGKWYKAKNDSNLYYIKFKRRDGYGIHGETMYVGIGAKYKEEDFWANNNFEKQALNKGALIDLTEIQQYLPEGHPDKIVKNPKFEVGKWYRVTDGKNKAIGKSLWYAKSLSVLNGVIKAGEYWHDYLSTDGCFGSIGDYTFTEVPLSEIQQYLPDGHPDKIKIEEKIPEYVECISWEGKYCAAGEVYPIVKYNEDIRYVTCKSPHFTSGNISCTAGKFKFSTKEAYEAQFNKVKEMTPEELLEKAIREYPIGTIHGGVSGTGNFKVTKTPYWLWGNIYGAEVGAIYAGESKHWAKIISKPESNIMNEQFTIGDWVVVEREYVNDVVNRGNNANFKKGHVFQIDSTDFSTTYTPHMWLHAKGSLGIISSLVRKALPHELPTTNEKTLANDWKVGDRVRLLKYPYAGLEIGEIGTITSIEGNNNFSVNNAPYCDPEFWEKIDEKEEKHINQLRNLQKELKEQIEKEWPLVTERIKKEKVKLVLNTESEIKINITYKKTIKI